MVNRAEKFDAWNPGISSEIPGRLIPMVTLYRPENANVGYQEARDAAEFCGLKPQDMCALTARRLIVHEVLIRVTADLFVPDGPAYEELGINLRSMAAKIIDGHLVPRMAELERRFSQIRQDAEATLGNRLDRHLYCRTPKESMPARRGFMMRLFSTAKAPPPPTELPEILALADWQAEIAELAPGLDRSCLESLVTIVGGIVGQRGRLVADRAQVIRLAANQVGNVFGSRQIGEWITPMILDAARAEGFRLLPYQAAPFIMNVKGASAAGKSTIRPLQRELAERLGIPWEDFALISPDYWRKFLLDYESLGEDYKYAAMLTGQELEIIDKKLDRYMEEKAYRAEMPHMLIDRFRFDSFAQTPSQQADGRLLSRFGDTVFLFLIITPPTETVERAWKRGITTGRYKAVDDLLYHNIEAYTGMPQLFFSWVNKKKQKIHFEFLDNSVALGARPRTVAFGRNNQLTVLDPECMRGLDRYQKINIEAREPKDVCLPNTEAGQDFLAECIGKVPRVTFLDPATLTVLGQTFEGRRVYEKDGFFAKTALTDPPCSAELQAKAGVDPGVSGFLHDVPDMAFEKGFTVGTWGEGVFA